MMVRLRPGELTEVPFLYTNLARRAAASVVAVFLIIAVAGSEARPAPDSFADLAGMEFGIDLCGAIAIDIDIDARLDKGVKTGGFDIGLRRQ